MNIALRVIPLLLLSCCLNAPLRAQAPSATADNPATAKPPAGPAADRTGKPRRGKASYYSRKFSGKKMANGAPMNPNANVAASKTLPLGTKARVTNLDNGRQTEVRIEDRGPYAKDRIIDVSPKAAKELGIKEEGVAPVEVKPLAVPKDKR